GGAPPATVPRPPTVRDCTTAPGTGSFKSTASGMIVVVAGGSDGALGVPDTAATGFSCVTGAVSPGDRLPSLWVSGSTTLVKAFDEGSTWSRFGCRFHQRTAAAVKATSTAASGTRIRRLREGRGRGARRRSDSSRANAKTAASGYRADLSLLVARTTICAR